MERSRRSQAGPSPSSPESTISPSVTYSHCDAQPSDLSQSLASFGLPTQGTDKLEARTIQEMRLSVEENVPEWNNLCRPGRPRGPPHLPRPGHSTPCGRDMSQGPRHSVSVMRVCESSLERRSSLLCISTLLLISLSAFVAGSPSS